MMQPLTIEYFQFEEDFMEDNIRCIPMIVRFKLDACGVKLKLKEWSKMTVDERALLAEHPIDSSTEVTRYKEILIQLINKHTGNEATLLTINMNPEWSLADRLPDSLQEKLKEFNLFMSIEQWQRLSTLQRFALLKLTRSGHENKNFPKAMKEFGLI